MLNYKPPFQQGEEYSIISVHKLDDLIDLDFVDSIFDYKDPCIVDRVATSQSAKLESHSTTYEQELVV